MAKFMQNKRELDDSGPSYEELLYNNPNKD